MSFFSFSLQKYKNYSKYEKKLPKNFVSSKKSSTFARFFERPATLAQLVEQRIRNA